MAILNRPAILAILTSLTVAGSNFCGADTTLRWKFKEGQSTNYVLEQNFNSKATVMGNTIDTAMKQTVQMDWQVKKAASSGAADLVQRFDRVQMEMKMPGNDFAFDSKENKVPEGPVGQMMGPVLQAMGGAQFTLSMTPQGETSNVTLPANLRDAVGANPQLQTMGFSEEQLKRMIMQGSVTFPAQPVKVGQSWNKDLTMKMPFGTQKVATTYTYQGPTTKNGKAFEKIGIKTTVSIEPQAGGPFEIKIKSQDGKGELLFDNEAGRLDQSSITSNLTMEISAMGQTFDQVVTTNVVLKLDPGASR